MSFRNAVVRSVTGPRGLLHPSGEIERKGKRPRSVVPSLRRFSSARSRPRDLRARTAVALEKSTRLSESPKKAKPRSADGGRAVIGGSVKGARCSGSHRRGGGPVTARLRPSGNSRVAASRGIERAGVFLPSHPRPLFSGLSGPARTKSVEEGGAVLCLGSSSLDLPPILALLRRFGPSDAEVEMTSRSPRTVFSSADPRDTRRQMRSRGGGG
jgi:hypothetical protein